MEAYLDNSATTVCSKAAAEAMMKLLTEDFGNPSAMHLKGIEAENEIKKAKDRIAKTLKCSPKEIIFTSGGTESNNMALIGAAMANMRAGKHIITTPFEHASVANPVKYLEDQGFDVTYIHVDEKGHIDMAELSEAMSKETILVSVMHVNNEVGAVQDIEAIGKIVKKINPMALFHVDAIQSYGKLMINPKKCNIDLLSVSGHKIHGPKGTGFLYVKEKTKIKPLILGGGQQDGLRSGTENVPGYVGLSIAAEEAYTNLAEKLVNIFDIKVGLTKAFCGMEDVFVNGTKADIDAWAEKTLEEKKEEVLKPLFFFENGAPHIVNVAFKNIRSEVLLHSLEDKNIYISAGSACSSHKRAPSATLTAIGVDKDLIECSVRFSLCDESRLEEADYAISEIEKLLPMLRKYTRH